MNSFLTLVLILMVTFSQFAFLSSNKIDCGIQQSSKAKSRRKANKSSSISRGDKLGEIVGGGTARVGDFPWQISLLFKGRQHCGGSIISSHWVITAAHCVALKGPKEVRVGGQYWYSGSSYKVIGEIVHPQYDSNIMRDDIALVKVAGPIKFSPGNSAGQGAVWPICLPKSLETHSGFALATGWGAIQENGKKSDKLKVVSVSILPAASCRRYPFFIPATQLCAGYERGGRDSCQGDSGGPLVKLSEDRATLIGVVSNGNGCARAGWPGIYTKVSSYLKFIFHHLNKA